MDECTAAEAGVAEPLTAEAARDLVEQARFHAKALLEIALRLYRGRAHVALGYPSWHAFAAEELGKASRSAAYDLLKAAAIRAESVVAVESGNPDPEAWPVGRTNAWRASLKPSHWLVLQGVELGLRDQILTDAERRCAAGAKLTVGLLREVRRLHVEKARSRADTAAAARMFGVAVAAARAIEEDGALRRLRVERGPAESAFEFERRCREFGDNLDLIARAFCKLRDEVRESGLATEAAGLLEVAPHAPEQVPLEAAA